MVRIVVRVEAKLRGVGFQEVLDGRARARQHEDRKGNLARL